MGIVAMAHSKGELEIVTLDGQMILDMISFEASSRTLYSPAVRVFGSVARGDAGPESDIDLLVEWDYTRISAWGGVGFELALQELLGRKVDVVSEKWLNPRLRDRILHEAVPL